MGIARALGFGSECLNTSCSPTRGTVFHRVAPAPSNFIETRSHALPPNKDLTAVGQCRFLEGAGTGGAGTFAMVFAMHRQTVYKC